jgi:thiamine-monophosphate kinase
VVAPSPGRHLIITTDTLVESIHFDLDYFDPWHLGRKAAAVNLSDTAAMGGNPRWAFLNLAVRPGLAGGFWDSFSEGLLSRLSEYGVSLIGGDTVSAQDCLSLSLTLIGEVKKNKWLSRSRAQPNDLIYCSGNLGEAAAGLEWLKKYRKKRRPLNGQKGVHGISRPVLKRLLSKHLDPEPRVTLGQALAASGMVQTAVDISDGIATDLAHVCKNSGVGAEVWAKKIPVSSALKRMSRILGISPLNLALTGGEDFELLWTVSKRNESGVRKIAAKVLGYRPFRIGKIVQDGGILLKTSQGVIDITYQGYEHYT